MNIQLWTDGGCDNTISIGAAAYCVVNKDTNELITEKAVASQRTTSNREEIKAILNGLAVIKEMQNSGKEVTHIEVCSDSAYVVNCFLQKWYVKWAQSNWRNAAGEEVKNQDLWKLLFQQVYYFKGIIRWTHVRGHQKGKFPWNDLCDTNASKARKALVAQMREDIDFAYWPTEESL